jgi:hypothetical protein
MPSGLAQNESMRKIRYAIFMVMTSFFLFNCNESSRKTIKLADAEAAEEIIFETPQARFYFNGNELIKYCETRKDEKNGFRFEQLITFVKNHPGRPVVIYDTLGTKQAREGDVDFSGSDRLVPVRDDQSPYAYVTEATGRALMDFAEHGNFRVFDKRENKYVDQIILERSEESTQGETNILLQNDSVIFSRLRWIK